VKRRPGRQRWVRTRSLAYDKRVACTGLGFDARFRHRGNRDWTNGSSHDNTWRMRRVRPPGAEHRSGGAASARHEDGDRPHPGKGRPRGSWFSSSHEATDRSGDPRPRNVKEYVGERKSTKPPFLKASDNTPAYIMTRKERSVEFWLSLLNHPSPRSKVLAIDRLTFGDSARSPIIIAALIRLVESHATRAIQSDSINSAALFALQERDVRDHLSDPQFLGLLQNNRVQIRGELIEDVSKIAAGDHRFLDVLAALLSDDEPFVRHQSALRLCNPGRSKHHSISPDAFWFAFPDVPHDFLSCKELIGETSRVERRAKAAILMGQFGERAVPQLVTLFDNTDPLVRMGSLIGTSWSCSDYSGHIMKCLSDPSFDVRRLAARLLGWAEPYHLPHISMAICDHDPEVRREAAITLGELEGTAAELSGYLLPLLNDIDYRVRSAAAVSLGKTSALPENEALQLAESLNDESERVRGDAAGSLREIGYNSAPILEALLCHAAKTCTDDGQDASHSMSALTELMNRGPFNIAYFQSVEAMKHLSIMVANGKDEIKASAFSVISRMGYFGLPFVDDMIKALKSRNRSVRFWSAVALGDMGPEVSRHVTYLAERLTDTDAGVQGALVYALRGLGERAIPAIPVLQRLLTYDDIPDRDTIRGLLQDLETEQEKRPDR